MVNAGQDEARESLLKRHSRLVIAVVVALAIILSGLSYEILTVPSSDINATPLKPVILGGYGFSYNGTTYPNSSFVSGNSFSADFEMIQGIPVVLLPGTEMFSGVAISALNASAKHPYTSVTFSVLAGKLTIGNYSTTTYNFGNGFATSLLFHIDTSVLVQYDTEGANYTATYAITVLPVLHYGIFYFKQKPVTLTLFTVYPWFHVAKPTA